MVPIAGKVLLSVYGKAWKDPVKCAGRVFSLRLGLDSVLQLFLTNARFFPSPYYIFKFLLCRANKLLKVAQNLLKTYGNYWHLCV